MRKSSLVIFNAVLLAIFLILGWRLWQMQVVEGGLYRNQADANRRRIITTKAIRGVVYDRHSRQLVSNRPVYAVAITPADLPTSQKDRPRVEAMFNYLADLLGTKSVVVVVADDLPIEKQADVVKVLAELLQVPRENLHERIDSARAPGGAHAGYTLLRRDLHPAVAAQLETLIESQYLPGISVMNELEYTYYTRQGKPYNPVVIKRDVSYDQMRQIEENHLKLPAVSIVPESVRQYLDGAVFSHILGYDGPISPEQYEATLPPEGSDILPVYDKDDKVGQTGIEASMEEVLRGKKGGVEVEVNSNQRIVKELNRQDPVPGQNVILTIDAGLQYSVTEALQSGLNSARTHIGAAVVLKVKTGEVLAMVSLPSYDNNLFAEGISQADLDQLNNDPYLPMFNNALSGSFAPGSTFKLITAAAALQEKVIGPHDHARCLGRIDVPATWDEAQRSPHPCWKKDGHGSIDVMQALEQSCDVFFYQMAGPRQPDELGKFLRFYEPRNREPQYFNGLGIARMNEYMKYFGLGERTGIDLPGEARGVAPDPAYKLKLDPETGYWSVGDTLQAAIGQGFDLVTPLQLANLTAAIANGGTLYRPQVVQQVIDSDGGTVVRDFKPEVLRNVPVSAETLAVIRQGMLDAVAAPRGTARRTNLKGVQVAGKTGTAEFGEPLPELGNVRAANAWFTAFAPYDNPEIAVVVLIKGEASTLEGSTFAVPVARDILKAYFHVNE
jgi:penicillin-binding protein 2